MHGSVVNFTFHIPFFLVIEPHGVAGGQYFPLSPLVLTAITDDTPDSHPHDNNGGDKLEISVLHAGFSAVSDNKCSTILFCISLYIIFRNILYNKFYSHDTLFGRWC
jgi:hypothetical protein